MPGVGRARCRLSSKPGVLEVAGATWAVATESGALLAIILLGSCRWALDPLMIDLVVPGFAALCEPLVSESIVCVDLPPSASDDR